MLTKDDIAEIKERVRREQNCPRHLYKIGPGPYGLGTYYICAHCGSRRRMFEIGQYLRGYVAAGGNPKDVCPDWKEPSDAS